MPQDETVSVGHGGLTVDLRSSNRTNTTLHWDLWDITNPHDSQQVVPRTEIPGTATSFTIPSSAFVDGREYHLMVRAGLRGTAHEVASSRVFSVKVEAGLTSGRIVNIPNTITEVLNGVSRTLNPRTHWFSYQRGASRPAKADCSRYRIVVGPKIINPNYPDNGRIWAGFDGLNFPVNIDALLEHRITGQRKIIECIHPVEDIHGVPSGAKAHTFNNYPDCSVNPNLRHPRNTLFRDDITMRVYNGDTGLLLENGLHQTGIAYPRSWNSDHESQVSLINRDGSTIEFDCAQGDLDFDPIDYRLIMIAVHN